MRERFNDFVRNRQGADQTRAAMIGAHLPSWMGREPQEVLDSSPRRFRIIADLWERLPKPLKFAPVGLVLAVPAIACAPGGSGGEKEATPTFTREVNPSPAVVEPSATLVPTIAEPTATQIPPTTEAPLYGSAPTIEELRSSVTAAFAGNLDSRLDTFLHICLEGEDGLNFDTINNEADALKLLDYCSTSAYHVQTEATGDVSAINAALDKLRDADFTGAERLVQKGVLSEGYLTPGQIQRRIDLYYSHVK